MKWLSEHLGQSFIVENRPGAGSNLATEMVVRAPPDGYTLLEISASNAWNATLYDNLNFNFIRDIVPIAGVRRAGGVMEVNPSVPVTTVSEFIAYAKANPGKINMATIRRRFRGNFDFYQNPVVGTKRTFRDVQTMSAFGGKADMKQT
jgi:tripartite-type tricarboxylate transporter receptor subunit TctC